MVEHTCIKGDKIDSIEEKVDTLNNKVEQLDLSREDFNKILIELKILSQYQIEANKKRDIADNKRDIVLQEMVISLKEMNSEMKDIKPRVKSLEYKFEISEDKNKIDTRDIIKTSVTKWLIALSAGVFILYNIWKIIA